MTVAAQDQISIPAAFIRGGTSKALFFHQEDLPPEREQWAPIFLSALGSPDPNGRQLNGMGGGISSLSKVCVVRKSEQPGVDLEYTFAQVAIATEKVSFSGNCGNISSAVGPYAIDEGLLSAPDGSCSLVLYNTNTKKRIRESFEVRGGKSAVRGELEIAGVAGTGSPVRLEFLDPGGAASGRLLPLGSVIEKVEMPDGRQVRVSVIDAANLCVFAWAGDLGLTGTEMPAELDSSPEIRNALLFIAERMRELLAGNMGRAVAEIPTLALVGFVSPAQPGGTLSGAVIEAGDADFTARMLSSGQPHRALPLTSALCMAVAAKIPGTVVHLAAGRALPEEVRIATPSGVLPLTSQVVEVDGKWKALGASTFRTQRRLFDGRVYLPDKGA